MLINLCFIRKYFYLYKKDDILKEIITGMYV